LAIGEGLNPLGLLEGVSLLEAGEAAGEVLQLGVLVMEFLLQGLPLLLQGSDVLPELTHRLLDLALPGQLMGEDEDPSQEGGDQDHLQRAGDDLPTVEGKHDGPAVLHRERPRRQSHQQEETQPKEPHGACPPALRILPLPLGLSSRGG